VVASTTAAYPQHCDRDELVAAGTFGLVEAARRFDPAKGVPFDRFAALRIRGAVLDAVRAADPASRSLRARARHVAAAREALEHELARTPAPEEVAERLGIPTDQLARFEGHLHRCTVLSLDAPTRDDEEGSLASLVLDPGGEPLEELERRERDRYVLDALDALPERLREVLVGGFLEGRTSEELAQSLGVTESRVSQMRTEALRLVRDGLAAQYGEPTTPLTGRPAARQAVFAAALAARSSFAARVSAADRRPPASRVAS
jgi:RNA polymerase sigma factor for flagellar operon FliA